MVCISTVCISATSVSAMVGPTAVMFPAGVIESAVIEVSGVVSVEEGAIVFEIDPVAIVTTPGRIVVVSISGEVCFTDRRIGVVAAVCGSRFSVGRIGFSVDGGRCGVYRCGNGSAHINAGSGYPETDMRTDDDLRITFSSDEAGSYNGGER